MSEVNKAVTKEQAKSLYDNLRGQLEATKENSIFIKPSEITNPATVSSNAAFVINAAITKANTNGMHFVVVPAGEYWLTETVYLKSDVILKGCGMDATTLKIADNCDIDAIRVSAPTNNSGIMDLTIDGNRIQNYSTFVNGHHGNAINVWLHYGRIERVRTNWVYKHSLLLNYDTGTGDDGLGFEPEHQNDMGNLNKVLWCDFRDSLLQGVMWGWRTMDSWMCYTNIGSHAANLYLEGGTSRFVGNHFDGDGDNGAGPEYNVYCGDGCRAMVFEDNIFENTQKENIFFRQPSYANQTMTITIANNIIRTCSKSQNEQYANIKISGYSSSVPATEIVISGNQILNPDTNANHGYAGIHLLYCKNSKITGNTFFNVGDDEVLLDNTCENVLDDSEMSEELHSLKTEINSKADKTVTDALQKDKAPVIVDSAEGNPIVLTDGAEGLPVEGMKIHFLPVQDLHGYDSPWPAGGGKNLFNIDGNIFDTQQNPETPIPVANYSLIDGFTYTGYIRPNNVTTTVLNGTLTVVTTDSVYGTGLIIPVVAGVEYTFSCTRQNGGYIVAAYYDANGFYVSHESPGFVDSFTCTIPDGASYLIVLLRGSQAGTYVFSNIQLEKGSSVTNWVPYSNICPIEGQAGLTVWRTGKNLLDPGEATSGKGLTLTKNADGSIGVVGTPTGTWIDFGWHNVGIHAGSYMLSLRASIPCYFVLYYYLVGNSERKYHALTTGQTSKAITFAGEVERVCFGLTTMDTSTAYDFNLAVQLEVGSTPSPYTPYVGQSYPVMFPDGQTVYGGMVDPINEVLTVTHKMFTDSGTGWTRTSSGGYYKWVFGVSGVAKQSSNDGLCNYGKYLYSNTGNGFYANGGNGTLNIGSAANAFNTVEELQAAFSSVPLQILAPLATPIEIQIDPVTIQTLLGDNTIWSDANGAIELDYRADTKLFIAKNKQDIRTTIAPIEDGAMASKAYSAGKLFYHDGNLCKAKTSIASGAAFTLNTNYEVTTVADELFALN